MELEVTGFYGGGGGIWCVWGHGDKKILGLALGLHSYAILFKHRLYHSTWDFLWVQDTEHKETNRLPLNTSIMLVVEILKQINNVNLDCIIVTELAGSNRNTGPVK